MKAVFMFCFLAWSICGASDLKLLEMSPPKVKAHQKRQVERAVEVRMLKFKGHIGENDKGYLAIRDLNGLKDDQKKNITKLVDDENKDRQAIYKEIIRVNKLSEKEQGFLIKSTFGTLRATDAKGTYHYENNKWQKKY